MKQLIISLFTVLMVGGACVKDQTSAARNNTSRNTRSNSNCEMVMVTQQGLGCDLWGVRISGTVYPAFNIPEQYKREGQAICITYELIQDHRDCPVPCCGGIWANILSIE